MLVQKPVCIALFCSAIFCLLSCNKSSWQLDVMDSDTGKQHILQQSSSAGKPVFINYWAEWCKPCLEEIPELNRFSLNHRDTVLLLGVNFDNLKDAALQASIKKAAIQYPVLVTNPASIFTLPEISGLPTTLMLDNNGNLLEALVGPQTVDSLEEALARHPLK